MDDKRLKDAGILAIVGRLLGHDLNNINTLYSMVSGQLEMMIDSGKMTPERLIKIQKIVDRATNKLENHIQQIKKYSFHIGKNLEPVPIEIFVQLKELLTYYLQINLQEEDIHYQIKMDKFLFDFFKSCLNDFCKIKETKLVLSKLEDDKYLFQFENLRNIDDIFEINLISDGESICLGLGVIYSICKEMSWEIIDKPDGVENSFSIQFK